MGRLGFTTLFALDFSDRLLIIDCELIHSEPLGSMLIGKMKSIRNTSSIWSAVDLIVRRLPNSGAVLTD